MIGNDFCSYLLFTRKRDQMRAALLHVTWHLHVKWLIISIISCQVKHVKMLYNFCNYVISLACMEITLYYSIQINVFTSCSWATEFPPKLTWMTGSLALSVRCPSSRSHWLELATSQLHNVAGSTQVPCDKNPV